MVGVIVAAHGRLADELLKATEEICGPCELHGMTLSVTFAVEDARAALADAIHEVDQGDGVLVLTDMLGGSPSNVALTFLGEDVEVVTGVNLPMLLKLATARGAGIALKPLAQLIAREAQRSIGRAKEFLRPRASTTSSRA